MTAKVLFTKYWTPHHESFFDTDVTFVQMKHRDAWRQWSTSSTREVVDFRAAGPMQRLRLVWSITKGATVVFQADMTDPWNLVAFVVARFRAESVAWWFEKPSRILMRHRVALRILSRANVPVLAVGHAAFAVMSLAGADTRRLFNFPYTYGADAAVTAPVVRDEADPITVLFDASQPDIKGYELVAAAIEQLGTNSTIEWKFLAAADEVVEKFAGDERVVCLDYIDPVDMPELLQSIDVLVMVPRTERWGVLAEEAMAAGATVVANREPGVVGELVVDGLTGVVLNEPEAGELAGTLLALSNDRSRLRELQSRAGTYVESHRRRFNEDLFWRLASK